METNGVSLADKIRWRLDAGELPRERPPKTWAGYGRGELCAGCDQKIYPAQVMYEMDWNKTTYRFHAGCHGLWIGALIHRGLYKPE